YVTSYCGPSDAKYAFVNEIVFPQWLGIADATQDEVEGLAAAKSFARARELVAQAVSKRAELGFTTHGHTGVDVNLYAYGWEAQKFRGNHENVDLGSIFIDLLKLDLDSVTARIAHDNTKQPTPYDPYAVDVLDMHD
ncbi:vacuolar alkaline phosphatase, partial [Spiromyces aspiralis]